MTALNDLIRQLKKSYKILGNWRLVGEQYKISGGMAYRIVNESGYEPKAPRTRCQLGLPAFAQAPVCPHCGEVHLKKSCPNVRSYSRLYQMPETELTRRLKNRKEIMIMIYTLDDIRKVIKCNEPALRKMLADAGVEIDTERADPGEMITERELIDLVATRAGDRVSRLIIKHFLQK